MAPEDYPASLLCGDTQHMTTEQLRALDRTISESLGSGMTDAAISVVICRLVNRFFLEEARESS